jgi:hypothetical protein
MMSKLTDVLSGLAGFFTHNQAVTAAAAPLAASLSAGAQAAEAALPTIAEASANAALALLGPTGSAFAPLADEFIDQVIVKLQAKKSTVATPVVQASATAHVQIGAIAPAQAGAMQHVQIGAVAPAQASATPHAQIGAVAPAEAGAMQYVQIGAVAPAQAGATAAA